MTLKQLQYFKAVFDLQSIKKASQALYVSQPTISTAIAKLEQEFAMPLFDRVNNRLVPTNCSHYLLSATNTILPLLDRITDRLSSDSSENLQTVRILSQGSFLALASCIAAFLPSHPHARFDLSDSITGDSLDLQPFADVFSCPAQIFEPYSAYYDHKINLPTINPVLVVRRGHHLSQKKSIAIADLKDESFAIIQSNDPPHLESSYALCLLNGFSPRVTFTCSDALTKLEYILSSDAVTFMSSVDAKFYECFDNLSVIRLEGNFRKLFPHVLAWNTKKKMNASAEAFCNFLEERFASGHALTAGLPGSDSTWN